VIQVFRPIPVERLKLLVFDLDGTLIDSAQDLCNSVNATLLAFNHQALPDPAIASFVGNGAHLLIRRSLALASNSTPEAIGEDLFQQAYAYFIKYYREHKLDYTYAYDGVLDALHALHQIHDHPGGIPRVMAVLTNKPVRPARGICEGLGLANYFLHIYGGDSFPVKKPDPTGLRSLMEETGAQPDETVMIGDSLVDVLTARNAGAWALGCSFGFGPHNIMQSPPDIMVDTADEWTEALTPVAANPPRHFS
jgi:phosphoglycolate phosphatase